MLRRGVDAMTPHFGPRAFHWYYRGLVGVWYCKILSLIAALYFLAFSAWLVFIQGKDASWLGPYVLAAGLVYGGSALVLRWG